MAKPDFGSVDAYIAAQPETAQEALQCVRRAIRKAAPGAEEGISYKMPAYTLPDGPLLYFAGWRRHYSLYPATDRVVAAFDDDLAAYTVDKATIRFPLSQPVPVKLIERIARLRAKEVGERAKEKAGAAKEQARARPAR